MSVWIYFIIDLWFNNPYACYHFIGDFWQFWSCIHLIEQLMILKTFSMTDSWFISWSLVFSHEEFIEFSSYINWFFTSIRHHIEQFSEEKTNIKSSLIFEIDSVLDKWSQIQYRGLSRYNTCIKKTIRVNAIGLDKVLNFGIKSNQIIHFFLIITLVFSMQPKHYLPNLGSESPMWAQVVLIFTFFT